MSIIQECMVKADELNEEDEVMIIGRPAQGDSQSATAEETNNTSTKSHPDESLREIAEDHFGDS